MSGERKNSVAAEIALRIGTGILSENSIDCLEKRVAFAAAPSAEVVQIERPNHGPAEFHVAHKLRFAPDHRHVVKRCPLVAFVRVRAHGALGVLNNRPARVLCSLANLLRKKIIN